MCSVVLFLEIIITRKKDVKCMAKANNESFVRGLETAT